MKPRTPHERNLLINKNEGLFWRSLILCDTVRETAKNKNVYMKMFLAPSCVGKMKGRKQINHPNLPMEKAVLSI
jgi:hypothetical protein